MLVQEAQESCRGRWNIPAGHLDPNETIIEGAKREILEECGYHVEVVGVIQIGNKIEESSEWISVIFDTEIVDGEINYDKNEILDAKWFTYEEILSMKNELKSYDWIVDSIKKAENNNVFSMDIIKIFK